MPKYETHLIIHYKNQALIPMNEKKAVQPEEDGPIYIEFYEPFGEY